MAFLADYDTGELKPDYSELSDANWFGIENLPPVAPRGRLPAL